MFFPLPETTQWVPPPCLQYTLLILKELDRILRLNISEVGTFRSWVHVGLPAVNQEIIHLRLKALKQQESVHPL